jgi:hypothetical protein
MPAALDNGLPEIHRDHSLLFESKKEHSPNGAGSLRQVVNQTAQGEGILQSVKPRIRSLIKRVTAIIKPPCVTRASMPTRLNSKDASRQQMIGGIDSIPRCWTKRNITEAM